MFKSYGMRKYVLFILFCTLINVLFSQKQPDTTYEYYFLSGSADDSTFFYENIYHYDSDGKILYVENLNKFFYICTGHYGLKSGNYVTYYEYDDSNHIQRIFMLDKNNDTVFKESFILINNDLEYVCQIKNNGKLVNYYRYYFYNIRNRASTPLLNEAFNQINGFNAYNYYHSDSINIEMFDTLSSEYYLYSKIYFNYLSKNLIHQCIQNFDSVSYILDLSYDSDLRCNGIECTRSLLDSCSDKCWYLSETFNENSQTSEISIIPYFSSCFKFYNFYGIKENNYYDENKNLTTSKVFNKDSLDNWNIYVSKYYKYDLTNIHAVEKSEMKIYPNPALSELLIDNGQELMKEVSLYDVMGRKVKHLPVNAPSTTIDVSDLPNGIYVVKINTASGVLVRKVQVVR